MKTQTAQELFLLINKELINKTPDKHIFQGIYWSVSIEPGNEMVRLRPFITNIVRFEYGWSFCLAGENLMIRFPSSGDWCLFQNVADRLWNTVEMEFRVLLRRKVQALISNLEQERCQMANLSCSSGLLEEAIDHIHAMLGEENDADRPQSESGDPSSEGT